MLFQVCLSVCLNDDYVFFVSGVLAKRVKNKVQSLVGFQNVVKCARKTEERVVSCTSFMCGINAVTPIQLCLSHAFTQSIQIQTVPGSRLYCKEQQTKYRATTPIEDTLQY